MMRRFRMFSRVAVIMSLLCGSVQVALAQAPGTSTGSSTILLRSQSITRDFVAVSVDRPLTLVEVQELVCEVTGDYRINIGASRTLELRMYWGIRANEYVHRDDLRFVDDDSRVVFQTQEEQVLAAYYWVSPDISGPTAPMPARGMTPGLELMVDGEGAPILPAEPGDFNHTAACIAPRMSARPQP